MNIGFFCLAFPGDSPSAEEGSFIPRSLLPASGADGGRPYLALFDGPHDLPLCNFKSVEKLFLFRLQEVARRILEPLCSPPSPPSASSSSTAGKGKQPQQHMEETIKIR